MFLRVRTEGRLLVKKKIVKENMTCTEHLLINYTFLRDKFMARQDFPTTDFLEISALCLYGISSSLNFNFDKKKQNGKWNKRKQIKI